MELREYLTENKITLSDFGEKIGRSQSVMSRICARKHRPDPSTAVRIVVATRAAITLDDLYGTPAKWRADRKQ